MFVYYCETGKEGVLVFCFSCLVACLFGLGFFPFVSFYLILGFRISVFFSPLWTLNPHPTYYL